MRNKGSVNVAARVSYKFLLFVKDGKKRTEEQSKREERKRIKIRKEIFSCMIATSDGHSFTPTATITFSFQNKTLSSLMECRFFFFFQGLDIGRGK